MRKALRKIIRSAPNYTCGTALKELYIIPSGKAYNGIWGRNGYDRIIILGRDGFKKFYVVSRASDEQQCDAIEFINTYLGAAFVIDVDSDYGCVRLNFRNKRVVIKDNTLSSIVVEDA